MRFFSNKILLSILLSLLSSCASFFSGDMRMVVTGELTNEHKKEFEKSLNKTDEDTSPFFYNSKFSDAVLKEKSGEEATPFVFDKKNKNLLDESELNKRDIGNDRGVKVLGELAQEKKFIEIDNADIVYEKDNLGKTALGFSYYLDKFKFEGPKDIFEKTYEQSTTAKRIGMLLVDYSYYYNRRFINLSLESSFGVGFCQGQGYFINGQESQTDFKLYYSPFDLGLGIEFSLGPWISLQATGGGSLMTLWQFREDRNAASKERDMVQFSPGYFASAKVKISLSAIFKQTSVNMFRTYDITKFYLVSHARLQEHKKFAQKDLAMSGMTFGLGLNFEFL